MMHLAFKSVRGRRRDNACASRAGSGRAPATTAATAAAADESAHDQESDDSNCSPDQDVRHSAPRFCFVVRTPLTSRPPSRNRPSSRRRTLCTIPFRLSVGKTTKSKSIRATHPVRICKAVGIIADHARIKSIELLVPQILMFLKIRRRKSTANSRFSQ